MAGSLRLGLVNEKGKVEYFGDLSGLSYEILENWKDYIGKVCEISGMEITKDNKLRHPRFICWRDDKKLSDCSTEQI